MFPLTVASVDVIHFEGDVFSVTCPAEEGEVTILRAHEPFVSPLKVGTIIIKTADGQMRLPVDRGLLEVHAGGVTILL